MIMPPPQPNPLYETSILDSVHVLKRLHTNVTRMDCVSYNPKDQHRYPGDRDVGGHVEDGGGGDIYPR